MHWAPAVAAVAVRDEAETTGVTSNTGTARSTSRCTVPAMMTAAKPGTAAIRSVGGPCAQPALLVLTTVCSRQGRVEPRFDRRERGSRRHRSDRAPIPHPW